MPGRTIAAAGPPACWHGACSFPSVEEMAMHPMPMPAILSEAQLLVMMLTVMAGVLILIGFVLWAARHAYQERERLRCPVRLRMTTVLFGLTPDGHRTDVLRCTLFRKQPTVTCGKACLYVPAR
jgi:hypothetical protein